MTGLITTALQGGGLIFGFTAFADQLVKLPGSGFSEDNVSSVLTIGHNITAWGCILSGLVLDKLGPRVTAVSGLLIEAVAHLIMWRIRDIPSWLAYVGYGMLGIGGCQVLLAALTFADAFRNASTTNSLITACFQAGGFIFMILPYVDWAVFFEFYAAFCVFSAVVTSILYPDSPLPVYSDETECSDLAELSEAMASGGTLKSILLRPGTIWFLLTFCVAGSAYTYGFSEFVVAIKDKDDCSWNEDQAQEVCANKNFQDLLNNVMMPIVGNFIIPMALLLGKIIDKWGFGPAAFINIIFVQAFVLCLWLLPLQAQFVTLVVYNVANTAVFTVQNAYICAVGHAHIGALFSISNFVMGAGNLVADVFSMNPFGEGDTKVRSSLIVSSIFWIAVCMPLYFWVIVEIRRSRRMRRGLEELAETASVATASCAPSAGNTFCTNSFRGSNNIMDVEVGSGRLLGTEAILAKVPDNGDHRRAGIPLLQAEPTLSGQPCNQYSHESDTKGALEYVAESVRRMSSTADQARDRISPSAGVLPRIECNLVVTVNPPVWDRKVQQVLAAGHEKVFFVLDFDRTVTKCFLEDGNKSLDCHDILASIPKITRDCRTTMEDMMEKYYPIEIHPTMTREEKIPHMVEWYTLVNALLAAQNLTRDDVASAVAGCRNFRLRSGITEVFGIAHRRNIPIIIVSAGLGNVIEEVVRQTIPKPCGTTGEPWPNVRVLSNTLQWDENGNHTGFSDPLIHMYNKSLQDAPAGLRSLIKGRHIGILCGDGTGDLTMAHGHETSEVLKVGFLNEKAEERLPKYIGPNCYDRVILNDGSFEPVLEVLRRL